MIQCIVSDMDGTLLPSGQYELDPQILQLARRLRERGILLAAASGRPYASLKRLWQAEADEMALICANGTLVVQNDQILYQNPLENQLARQMIQSIENQPECEFLVTGPRHCYIKPKRDRYRQRLQELQQYPVRLIENGSQIQEDILQVSVFREDGIQKSSGHFEALWGRQAQVMVSGKLWMDLTAPDANKGSALARLLDTVKLPAESVLALGDSYNDISLFRQAGHSYAMAWSPPEVQQAADCIIESPADELRRVLNQA